MAVEANALKTKMVLKFEEGGSKTYSNCKHTATDTAIYDTANTIAGIQINTVEHIVKTVESELINV